MAAPSCASFIHVIQVSLWNPVIAEQNVVRLIDQHILLYFIGEILNILLIIVIAVHKLNTWNHIPPLHNGHHFFSNGTSSCRSILGKEGEDNNLVDLGLPKLLQTHIDGWILITHSQFNGHIIGEIAGQFFNQCFPIN